MHSKSFLSISLFFFCLIFLVINIFTLHADHHWGDDFAQYLIHARNILNGEPYMSGLGIDPYAAVAPGLPLLLAFLMKNFGSGLLILKLPNVLFWLLNALVLYLLIKDRLGRAIGALSALLFLSSYYFFTFKQHILTDIPFMFFVTATVYAFDRYAVSDRTHRWLAAGLLCLFGAILFRWAGLILFVSAAFYYGLIKRDTRALLGLGFIAIAGWLVFHQVGFTAQAYQKALVITPVEWLKGSLQQIGRIPVLLGRFYLPSPLPDNYTALVVEMYKLKWVDQLLAFMLAGGVLWSFARKSLDRSLTFAGCFFAVYYIGYIAWWIPADGRYLLPIIGLFVIFVSNAFCTFYSYVFHQKWGIFKVPPQTIIQILLVVMILFNGINVMLHAGDREKGIHSPEVLGLAQWLQANLKEDDHYMFVRPRALAWLSERTGAAFVSPQNKDSFMERFQKMNIDYLIVDNSRDPEKSSGYLLALKERSVPYQPVYANDKYVVQKVER